MPMKHKTPFSLVFVSRIVVTLAMFFVALPVVGARRPESTSGAQTRDLYSAAAIVPGARFVHTATAANTAENYTFIDHPLTNGNRDAIVLVTKNMNPGGGAGGTGMIPPLGVFYSFINQKWGIFIQNRATMVIGTDYNVLIPARGADAFVHAATAANTYADFTLIDHPRTNNNPNAIVLVTQNWNPGGGSPTYNDHHVGVWYNGGAQKWAIWNRDGASMPVGANLNVLIPPTGADAFVHTATPSNISGDETYIDHPLTNDNPNAIVLVTGNQNPGGGSGTHNNNPIAVMYDEGVKKWNVENLNSADMPTGAAFNVLIPATDSAAFVHTATTANTFGHYTYIDHSLTNDNPNAIVFVTQNWSAGGGSGTYNDHAIGVRYFHGAKKWAIFNQDLASMPIGAAFNVLIPAVDLSVFVHIARAENIYAFNHSPIDHPLTNLNPNSIVLVTQNYNPSGVGGTYNNRPVGVMYHPTLHKWLIRNQDVLPMPEGAAFNVLVASARSDAFVHTATAANTRFHYTVIAHTLTNDNPRALVFVTGNRNPGGGGSGASSEHPVGVWYRNSSQKWAIFNQDNSSSMPIGASFNVLVIAYKLYLPAVLRGS
jgi:hypothetical protein